MNEYKYDQGKPRLDLVPPGIIEAVGMVRTYGMQKYKTEDGWQNVEPKRYVAALNLRERYLYVSIKEILEAKRRAG